MTAHLFNSNFKLHAFVRSNLARTKGITFLARQMKHRSRYNSTEYMKGN